MGTFRRLWLVLALAVPCALGGATGASADEHGTRIAVIEMGRILEEATAVHSIRNQGETQRQAYAEEAQREAEASPEPAPEEANSPVLAPLPQGPA